ncbi:chromate transporter [Clostridium swellfunianum]|uniref:chromate transporter n=1 Tax=Clostridium swellfunianum TaxID=1367462 RepID=UPI00202E0CA3|nr:chromate transporter [Clostridium swellfunianum]MCM0649610.1 chromate transporter [Clostridium swellfunianum]
MNLKDFRKGDSDTTILLQLFSTFFKIGLFSFGGGYAMIPIIQKEIVNKRAWVHKDEIIDVLAVAQSTPGAVAVNSATAIGYKIYGKKGAFFSTIGVALPSFLIIITIASLFARIKDYKFVQNAFDGIGAAVVALIITATISVSKNSIKDKTDILLAVVTFVSVAFFKINPIFVIVGGALYGSFIYLYKFSTQANKIKEKKWLKNDAS